MGGQGGESQRGSSTPGTYDDPLTAFKNTAISLANFYKSVTRAQAETKQEGYQECLQELVTFLNSRNLGLADGEGWDIRSWATERLQNGGNTVEGESEDDDDKVETSSSPELHRTVSARKSVDPKERLREERMDSAPPATRSQDSLMAGSDIRSSPITFVAAASPPLPIVPVVSQPTTTQTAGAPIQDAFTFQSSVQFPEPPPNLESLAISESSNHSSQPRSFTMRSSRGRLLGHGRPPPSRAARLRFQGAAASAASRKRGLSEMSDIFNDIINLNELHPAPKRRHMGDKDRRSPN